MEQTYDIETLKYFQALTWLDLFKPLNFFIENPIYLQIEVLTDKNSDRYLENSKMLGIDHLNSEEIAMMHHNEYKGLYESRLKLFQ